MPAVDMERRAKWLDENKERLRAYKREWARANPDSRRQSRRKTSPESKERHAAYIKARKAEQNEWLKAYRESHGCVDCGKTDGRLEFDHRPGTTKSFNVTQGLGLSWQKLRAEVARCDVRCSRCHRQRHAAARGLKTHKLPA